MSAIKALIFDLDGVLADTMPLHFRAWQHLAAEHGLRLDADTFEQYRGRHSRESVAVLFAEQMLSDAQIDQYLRTKNDHYLAQIEALLVDELLTDGAYDLVRAARDAGLRTGLASSSTNTQAIVEKIGLRPYFDVIADGFTVDQPKPAPDIFLSVADALGVAPSDCVVFEDSPIGVAAARAAGMFVIGITPATPADTLSHAQMTLQSLAHFNLAEFLQHQNKLIFGSYDA